MNDMTILMCPQQPTDAISLIYRTEPKIKNGYAQKKRSGP